MKKRFFVLAGILVFSFLTITGCGQEKNKNNDTTKEILETQNNASEDKTVKEETDEPEVESEHPEDENTQDSRPVTIFYVDGQTGQISTKDVQICNEFDIWTELQNEGILTDDCKLLSLETDNASKTMKLDFNVATGERIRSMGTTGETEIIGCIVNTYLNAYDCEKIKLTEEGGMLESSHASYDGYISYVEF